MLAKMQEALEALFESDGYGRCWAEVHEIKGPVVSFFVIGDYRDHAAFDELIGKGDWAGTVFEECGYEEVGDDRFFAAIHTYCAVNIRSPEETGKDIPTWGIIRLWKTRRSRDLPWTMYFVEADGADRSKEGCTLIRSWKHANYVRVLAA